MGLLLGRSKEGGVIGTISQVGVSVKGYDPAKYSQVPPVGECPCCCYVDTNQILPITYEQCLSRAGRGCSTLYSQDLDNLCACDGPCEPENIAMGPLLGADAFSIPNGGSPARYKRARACMRFYYRIVDYYRGSVIGDIPEGQGSSAVDLSEALYELAYPNSENPPILLPWETCGLYVYGFVFYRWWSSATRDLFFNSLGGAQLEITIDPITGDPIITKGPPEYHYMQRMYKVGLIWGDLFSWPPPRPFPELLEPN